jgi:predicted deacylase
MNINDNNIEPGENKIIKIRVGKLPSGTHINIFAHVFRGKKQGKTLLILGGIHGDEINGIEIIRSTIEKQYFDDLIQGTVIVIPLLNVYGFINFSREVPDGKDVNRSFPGSTTGSLAARVANKLTKFILPNVDYILDFHTGGNSRYNYPQIRYTKSNNEAKKLAYVFNPPFIIEKPLIPKSLRKTAHDMNIPILVYEGGESTRLDDLAITTGMKGIKNILYHLEMIDHKPGKQETKPVLINKTSWIRSRDSGIFKHFVESGKYIYKNDIVGVLKDVLGNSSKNIIAKRNAYIVGHNNAPVVNMGDALFNLGWYDENKK